MQLFAVVCLCDYVAGTQPRAVCIWWSEAELHSADRGYALFSHCVRYPVALRTAELHRAAQSPGQSNDARPLTHSLPVSDLLSAWMWVSVSGSAFVCTSLCLWVMDRLSVSRCLSVIVCHSWSGRFPITAHRPQELLTGTLANNLLKEN